MFGFGNKGDGGTFLERYGGQLGTLVERRHREAALLSAKREADSAADLANAAKEESESANIALRHEVDERLKTLAHLEYVANHDSLTDLPNRNLFNNRLAQMLESAKRTGQSVALMFLDLDHFKSVNDSLGHAVGDELLKIVAQRLVGCVRAQDTVARLGGDEFAIIQVGLDFSADAYVQANRILSTLGNPISVGSHKLFSGASIGITVYPGDADTVEHLQKNADLAMYQAKEDQRNTFRFFDAEMNASVQRRLFLEQELRTAVNDGQFAVYFQPKVSLRDGKVAGAEALIRWRHPEHGMISPAEFIPVAERTGTISQIGEWTMEQACRQFHEWQAAGQEPLIVAVNLSPAQFKDRNVPQMVRDILRDTKLDPSCLELEITETAVMRDMGDAMDVLHELHEIGVGLSIDDFGTGYSSLSYLRQLPVNRIKIDRSFVSDLDQLDAAATIARAVVMLGKSLGLTVVAEGVEKQAQLEYLRRLDCDEAQGHFFSQPLPADDFHRYVAQYDSRDF
jgi:diguanylate cyclase (GGDEF)-like protein